MMKGIIQSNAAINIFLFFIIIFGFHLLNDNHGYEMFDVSVYLSWTGAWLQDPQKTYLVPGTFYPYVGTLGFALPLKAIIASFPGLPIAQIEVLYKWAQFPIDIANISLFSWILSTFRIPKALTISLLVFLLPAFWVNGAAWGILDNLTQFFMLLSLSAMTRIWVIPSEQERPPSILRDSLYFLLAVLGLVFGVMTKQTFLFSVPGLIIGIGFAAVVLVQRHQLGYYGILVGLGLGILPLIFINMWLELPNGYFDHITYILFERSPHANAIDSYGIDLWYLIRHSSNALDIFIFNLSYKQFGMIAFLSSMLFIGGGWFTFLLRPQRTWKLLTLPQGPLLIAVNLCLFLSLSNLSFNLFLTGTHERYPCHIYLFLWISVLLLRQANLLKVWQLWSLSVLSFLYGCYVWLVMGQHFIAHAEFFGALRYCLVLAHGFLFVNLWIFWTQFKKMTVRFSITGRIPHLKGPTSSTVLG